MSFSTEKNNAVISVSQLPFIVPAETYGQVRIGPMEAAFSTLNVVNAAGKVLAADTRNIGEYIVFQVGSFPAVETIIKKVV